MPAVKTRPSRPAVPALPALETLDKTHHQMLQMLARLQALADQLQTQDAADGARALAREICQFFDDTARAHHAVEEQFVFPLLLRSGDAALVQHVQRLQQDHGWLEEDWREMRPQLQAVAEGYAGYDVEPLRAAIPVFTELYREHIALEETVVYPASRRLTP